MPRAWRLSLNQRAPGVFVRLQEADTHLRDTCMANLPYWILEHSSPDTFPDIEQALTEPNGLLAVGGDLSPTRLLHAYRRGIFPWFNDDRYILWWSPDPRAVLFPQNIKISRSLGKTIKQKRFKITVDRAFAKVMSGCAAPRTEQHGTWITEKMFNAYTQLHAMGYAHSVETWMDSRLAGGLYGVAMGKVFFGESMFSRERDASKVALVHLCALGFEVIDCQLSSDHLTRMGALDIARRDFATLLDRFCSEASPRLGG